MTEPASVQEQAEPTFLTAKQTLSTTPHHLRWHKVPFRVSSLDHLTGGGVACRGIFEIAGDAGSGKTQLALHLALVAQLQDSSRKPRGVVYISTEHPFPSKRLVQMEQAHKIPGGASRIQFSDNIFVEHLNSAATLEQCLTDRLPVLLESNSIGLLVIDSIAAVYADERNYVDRASSFRRVVRQIHALQERFDFAAVCTNQVRSVIDDDDDDDEDVMIPAMGLAWSSLVHTRLQLKRLEGSHRRNCRLIFSPTVPSGECHFVITAAGIESSV